MSANDLADRLDAHARWDDAPPFTPPTLFADDLRAAAALLRAQAEQLDTFRNDIREQVRELRAVHRPQWASARGYTIEPRDGYDPVGCVECYPHDGSWPCITAEVIDALAAAGGGVPETDATDEQ